MLSVGGDKSYTGSFKHRVGERILFCHISRQAGGRKSVGPHVFSAMHGTRLAPPALRGPTTAHRFPQDGPDPGTPRQWRRGSLGAPTGGHSTPCGSSPWEVERKHPHCSQLYINSPPSKHHCKGYTATKGAKRDQNGVYHRCRGWESLLYERGDDAAQDKNDQ